MVAISYSEPLPSAEDLDAPPDGPFRTISQVAEALSIPQHVLRFWETRFDQLHPVKSRGGRRYYRPEDVDMLQTIKALLYDKGYTIRGVQNLLNAQRSPVVRRAARETAQNSAPAQIMPLFDAAETDAAPAERPLSEREKAVIRQIVLELTTLQHLLVSGVRTSAAEENVGA